MAINGAYHNAYQTVSCNYFIRNLKCTLAVSNQGTLKYAGNVTRDYVNFFGGIQSLRLRSELLRHLLRHGDQNLMKEVGYYVPQ